jgi:hypothetical protein
LEKLVDEIGLVPVTRLKGKLDIKGDAVAIKTPTVDIENTEDKGEL